jgi:hypothetical protein
MLGAYTFFFFGFVSFSNWTFGPPLQNNSCIDLFSYLTFTPLQQLAGIRAVALSLVSGLGADKGLVS